MNRLLAALPLLVALLLPGALHAQAGKKPPLCYQCGQPVTGESILVKDQYHFHPAHFLCVKCGRSLASGEFFWREEAPWCRACYEAAVLPKCSICGEVIRDAYSTDGWGNSFHSRHEEELKACTACDRLICGALTGGGGEYADGRAMCSLCRQSAVETAERVKALVPQAVAFLAGLGVKVEAPPVRLVSLAEFEGKGGDSVMTSGRTAAAVVTRVDGAGVKTVERRVDEIQLLSGLPEKLFLFVLVHELVHAYLHPRLTVPVEKQAEEGVATLASYLWARDRDDPLAGHLMGELESRTDSYGRAFRDARRKLDYTPFRDLVDKVAREGRL